MQQAIPAGLARVVESILQISEQIDLDALAFTLERIVSMFPDELAPFAVQLCTQLVHTFVRILDSYKTVTENNVDENAYFEESDKMMAAIGMLSTINTLVESMSTSPEIMAQLEPVCLPMVLHVLNTDATDVFEETFELLDSITFSRKAVTAEMWSVFEAMYRIFKYTQSGPDYLNDMYTTLDNMVTYGRTDMPSTHIAAAVDIVETVFKPRIQEYANPQAQEEPSFSEADLVSACKLAESLMLNLSNRLSNEQFIKVLDLTVCSLAARQLHAHQLGRIGEEGFRGGFHTITCYVTQLQVILNGFYFDAVKTLQVLEHRTFSAVFFDVWFTLAPKVLTRVHDRRLNIIAIQALLRLPQLPPSISTIWIGKSAAVLLDAIHGLPASLSTRARLQKEFEEASEGGEEEDEFLDDSEYDEIQDSDAEEEAAHERNFLKPHLSHMSSLTQGEDDEGEYEEEEDNSEYEDAADELEEELYFETVLDSVDFAATSKQAISLLKPELLTNLTMEQRHFLQSIA